VPSVKLDREGDGRSAQAQIAGQRRARRRRSAPKIASAAMASRNACGIFLLPRSFTVMNVAPTNAVVTTHTHTM
jgi:hypothetical protein